jgi:hypothetical protein
MTLEELAVADEGQDTSAARRAILDGTPSSSTAELRYRRKDGRIIWVNVVSTVERSDSEALKHLIAVFEEITDRKLAEQRHHRLNRLHKVLSRTVEAIVRAPDRQSLYDAVCRIVVEDGRLRMAFIAEADPTEGQIQIRASCGAGVEYLQQLKVTSDGGPHSQGTAGTALRTGVHDYCNDLATAPAWRPGARRSPGSDSSRPLPFP